MTSKTASNKYVPTCLLLMFLTVLGLTHAIIFKDTRSGLFLAAYNGDVAMSPYPAEAADFSLLETVPDTVAVVLSVGTQALYVEKGAKKIDFTDVNRNDSRQFFELILRPQGSFVFQHNDLCIGYLNFFPNKSKDREYPEMAMIDCNDSHNVVSFYKSERIDGEVRKRRMLAYVDTVDTIADMEGDVKHVPPVIQDRETEVERFQDEVIKPEGTGFLRGLHSRPPHLF